jgi:cyclic pyranopterin phosphate synthase
VAIADTALPVLRSVAESSRTFAPMARAPHGVRGRRLVDAHGRTIRDLRISITDRCNFRCVYCMDPSARFASADTLLSVADFARVARIACSLGVRKIRLTGGEPTMHPRLTEIIGSIARGCDAEIAMITNGSLATRDRLSSWRDAGLERLTISIDSLREDRFAAITRSQWRVRDVIAAIEGAIAERLTPVKVNAVLVRGINDDEAADLAGLARAYAIEVRFIEYMPLDSGHEWDSSRWVSAAETRRAIEQRHELRSVAEDDPSSTARVFEFADGAPGRVGFIAPVSAPFCGACSRLRLTADGMVRPCLFSQDEWDLRALLRSGASDVELAEFLTDAAWNKQAKHGIDSPGFHQPQRSMSAIGG